MKGGPHIPQLSSKELCINVHLNNPRIPFLIVPPTIILLFSIMHEFLTSLSAVVKELRWENGNTRRVAICDMCTQPNLATSDPPACFYALDLVVLYHRKRATMSSSRRFPTQLSVFPSDVSL